MDPILRWMQGQQKPMIALIRAMVECESSSDDESGISQFVGLVEAECKRLAPGLTKVKRYRGGHVLVDFDLSKNQSGVANQGQILALGHSDTVWPRGTLNSMPFRQRGGRLWGPGVLDMKSGVAFFIFAMKALSEFEIPVSRRVVMLLVSDEETGSKGSRALTERVASQSSAVLVLEPGTGLTGKLKTARKGIAGYRLRVTGKASHAGVDFEAGASAVVELARQIGRVAELTDLARGITLNPGVIEGGTRSNVVAAHASVEIDVRAPRLRDAAAIDKKLRAVRPFDKRCSLQVTGGLNRPPMERSAGIARLFETARECGTELGITLEESSTGGGSDGNFTAALGIPTLDGLGAVGEGAHAIHESILTDRMADRAALLAKLVARI